MSSTLVYKFGGASVKDASALKNLYDILQPRLQKNTVLVVSAMAKTTNALEAVLAKKLVGQNFFEEWAQVAAFHTGMATALFPEGHPIFQKNLAEDLSPCVAALLLSAPPCRPPHCRRLFVLLFSCVCVLHHHRAHHHRRAPHCADTVSVPVRRMSRDVEPT